MKGITRLTLDSLWLLAARIGGQACAVVVTYLLARRMGVTGFGEYSFIVSVVMIGNVATTFGTDMYIIREIAARSDFSHAPSALNLQLVLSGLLIGMIFVLTPSIPNQSFDGKWALCTYSLSLFPLAFFNTFTALLRGLQKISIYAMLNIIVPVLQAAMILLFIPEKSSLVTLASLMVFIQLLGAIVAGIFCSSYIPLLWPGLHLSLQKLISLIKLCFPIALIAILGILFQRTSLAMTALLGSASMAGVFAASLRVVEAARTGHIAALTALYPAMANSKGDNDSSRTFKWSWFILLFIAAGWTLALFNLAKPLADIFFGEEFRQSIPILRILSFTMIPYSINSFLALKLLAEKRERVLVRVLFISLITLLLSNLWWIPRAGQLGAGWSLLIGETLQAILLLSERRFNHDLSSQKIISGTGVAHDLPDPSR